MSNEREVRVKDERKIASWHLSHPLPEGPEEEEEEELRMG